MAYKRSAHRIEFDRRVEELLVRSRSANRGKSKLPAAVRDMVFQCAVFQASAAFESYLKLLLESWSQRIRASGRVNAIPLDSRAFLAAKNVETAFAQYTINKDEKRLIEHLKLQNELWPFVSGSGPLHPAFKGEKLYDGVSYPSEKNLIKLFNRLGITNLIGQLNRILKRDVSLLIEGYQSVRTALAHSNPPDITIEDVSRLLGDLKALARALDRTFYNHVRLHSGLECWPVA